MAWTRRQVSGETHRTAATTWGPLVLLLAVTIIVPALIFDQFRGADDDRRRLLQKSVAEQGLIVTRMLASSLERPVEEVLPDLALEVARIDPSIARVRIFVRKTDEEETGFFYVATNARLLSWQMETERREIIALGLLERLGTSCTEGRPVTTEYQPEGGAPELITSITPHLSATACWAVLLSHPIAAYGRDAVDTAWDSPQIHAALALYVTMVVAAIALVLSVLLGVRRLTRAARGLREGAPLGQFDDRSAMPEIADMARELDRLVATLRNSADDLKRAAEDNAHALKTPVAALRHAAESLRREELSETGKETIALIARVTDRLSDLVQSIRRLDEAAADSLVPDQRPVDLTAMLHAMTKDYGATAAGSGLTIEADIVPGLTVAGDADLLETVFENLLDNALSFAPHGTKLRIDTRCDDGTIVITVADQGPGVAPDLLERIFDRHVSLRSSGETGVEPENFGIGLWIARRYVTAHGGAIEACNVEGGGLAMTVTLPRSHTPD